MSDKHTPKPHSALEEFPHPGQRGKILGLGCGESIRSPKARRYYKRKATRKVRREVVRGEK